MADHENRIDIIITTMKKGLGDKQTKATLKDLKGGFKELTGISLGWAGAVTTVAAVLKSSIDATTTYADQVERLNHLTGMNATQASQLIQVNDDLFISYESLAKAIEGANKRGFDTSVEGLQKLSDEFKTLPDGMKQSQFLMQKFGKTGNDLYKFMELGADGIEDKMSAVSKSLIIDERGIAQAREYKENVDNLSDAWQGIKIAIGNGVIPVLNSLMSTEKDADKILLNNIQTQIQAIQKGMAYSSGNKEIEKNLRNLEQAEKEVQKRIEDKEAAELGASQTTEEYAAAQELLTEKLADLKTIIGGEFGKEIDNFDSKMGDLKDKAGELKSKIDELEGKQYLTAEQSEQLEELRGDYADAQTAISDLANEHEAAMKRMAFNMLMERAASDGLTENEVNNLTKIGQAWGLYDQTTADVISAINENMGTLDTENPSELKSILEGILGLPSEKEFHFTISTEVKGTPIGGIQGALVRNNQGKTVEARAAGGPVYPGMVAMVGEKGPEPVVFGAAGQVYPTGTSLGDTININVSGVGNPEAVTNRLLHQLKLQQLRR